MQGAARLLLLAVLAVAPLSGGCGTIRAARLLRDTQRPAHELAEGLEEHVARVGDVSVLVYRPEDEAGPWPAMLLCHGAVDGGAGDPRLVSLARAFAQRGVLVACPDLSSLRTFRADPRDVDRLARVTRWLADLPERGLEPVSLMGISIGGAYCLMAASRPEVRTEVDAVLAFGAYADLERIVLAWMTSPPPALPDMYDPSVEGRRRVFLGNLDALVPPQDVEPMRRLLVALLMDEALPPDAEAELSPAGTRLLESARSPEPIDPAAASALIAPIRADLQALTPLRDGEVPAARVFLLHGEGDPIASPAETLALEEALDEAGVRVRSHVTDVFAHVEAGDRASFTGSWSLCRFLAGFLSAAGI